MTTKAGAGFSENPDSRLAGAEAARAALTTAGLATGDLVVVFATSKHDPALLRDGVRSVVGPRARLFGGSAVGIITRDRLGYEGYQVGVAVLASDTVTVDMFLEKGLPDNEYDVGVALGRRIKAHSYVGGPNVLLMYDIVKRTMAEGLSLNMATPLISGLSRSLGTWPPTVGGGMTGDMQWNPTFQCFDDAIEQQSAMAVVLAGGVRLDTVILHGCKPSGSYHTITKADGNVVLEIDGRRTVDVIAELLGPDADTSWENYPLFITLGINHGDKFGEVREDDYAVRLCMDVDRARGGLVMFGDDLEAGCEVQLMRRSIDFEYIGRRVAGLLAKLGDRTPVLALYIDCAGRASAYCGTEREEAEEVQKAIGARMPLLGWYVGCEIARAGELMQSHNWTGVLSVLSE
jgi:hypothetical protein